MNQPSETSSTHSSLADNLQSLGQTVLGPTTYDPTILEWFPNDNLFDFTVTLECPEWTGLCPKTNQPDFGEIIIEYIPDQRMVESKSLKLYLVGFRNHGCFHEKVVNLICDDLCDLLKPKKITVWGNFKPRGGIAIKVSKSLISADYNTQVQQGLIVKKVES